MADRKKTDRKCAEIMAYIVNQCNEEHMDAKGTKGPLISFGPDWGGNSLTVYKNGSHSHVGNVSDDGTFEQLIDQLHDLLIAGRGLSWE